jgi:predicted translin family RNA/ssDNA-binding protein
MKEKNMDKIYSNVIVFDYYDKFIQKLIDNLIDLKFEEDKENYEECIIINNNINKLISNAIKYVITNTELENDDVVEIINDTIKELKQYLIDGKDI